MTIANQMTQQHSLGKKLLNTSKKAIIPMKKC